MRLIAGILCSLAPALLGAEPFSAELILDRALAVAEAAVERHLELRYRWRHLNLTRTPKQTTRKIYRVRPVDGEPFYELVEVDGRPPSKEDLGVEADLRESFRSRVGGRSGIVFDRQLMSRYRVALEGRRVLGDRPSWVISFEPLDETPPVRRSVDHALNESSGRLWIDAQDYGLARIDFALQQPVKVWAGILGEVQVFEGSFQQHRVEAGGWLPASLDLRIEGRALFSSLDREVDLDWSDYRLIAGDQAEGAYHEGGSELQVEP